MKAVLIWGCLAAVGFVAYQQWDCHRRNQGRTNPGSPLAAEATTSRAGTNCVGPVTIRGRVYEEAELRRLYARVQHQYVMCNGVCRHRWQQPDGSALSYPDFVHQFKNGYAFTELSEPGSGDTLILEHRGLRRRIKNNGSRKAGGQSVHVSSR